MHPRKLESVTSLPGPERYAYFVRKVADSEAVWGLFDDGWAMAADDAGQPAMPFWPERDFAEACADAAWAGYQAKSIAIADFVAKWLPGLEKDGLGVAVFPTVSAQAVYVPPSRLLADLTHEFEQYE